MNNIMPITSYIPPIGTTTVDTTPEAAQTKVKPPSFLDVFTNIFNEAVESNQIVGEDRIRLMLGNAEDIEQIQLNIQKAELATELFVNIRNSVLDSYNEIIRMQI